MLTTKQLAEELNVHPETIRRWVRDGLIPVVRAGTKTHRFNLEDVLNTITTMDTIRGEN